MVETDLLRMYRMIAAYILFDGFGGLILSLLSAHVYVKCPNNITCERLTVLRVSFFEYTVFFFH